MPSGLTRGWDPVRRLRIMRRRENLPPGLVHILWSGNAEVLPRPIRYVGDDLHEMERKMKTFAPSWLAYDMRLMLRRYQRDGAVATPAVLERLTTHLGRRPRSLPGFAAETAKQWAAAPQATLVATAARTA